MGTRGRHIAAGWRAKELLRDLLRLTAKHAGRPPTRSAISTARFKFQAWCADHAFLPELASLAETVDTWWDGIEGLHPHRHHQRRQRRQQPTHINYRVLQHVCDNAPYLLGPERTGPLAVGAPSWDYALTVLRRHSELIIVDQGVLDLKLDRLKPQDAERRGLYILAAGEVREQQSGSVVLRGADFPVLWIDVPNLLQSPPRTYDVHAEPVKFCASRHRESAIFNYRNVKLCARRCLMPPTGRPTDTSSMYSCAIPRETRQSSQRSTSA